ncbi:MAG: sulfatase-like hydrolase/transferase [Kiritimatiellia bacterium]
MNIPKQTILIMTDTQRWDMLGCYGNADMKTPQLDRLAAEGMRFDQAYTCQPVCGPARSALFTGTYPHSNGGWGNTMPIGDTVKTLGQRLKKAGVHAGYVGKWHVDGGDYFGMGCCPEGWDPDYWYDMKAYLEELSDAEKVFSRAASSMKTKGVEREFTFAHRCSNRAIEFLRKHKDESFLLVVSYDEPHHPYLCPPPFDSFYNDYAWPKPENADDDLQDKPEHHKVWAESCGYGKNCFNPGGVADWLNCNSFVDDEIGRVLDAVDAHAENALVVYTSDHGDMCGSHGIVNKGAVMYEENIRIPLIARWKGVIPEGSVYPHPVSHIDLVPTLLEQAGVPLATILDGKSLIPALRDPGTRINDEVFIEFGRYEIDHDGFGGFQPIRCVFDGRYKLAINLLSSDELYDLQEDPGEMVNLIHSPDHTTIRDRLHDRLLEWMNDTRDAFRGYYWERRPWRTDARKATWDYTAMTRQRIEDDFEPRQLDYNTGLAITEAVRPK